MEPHIRARFTPDTRAELARVAGVAVDDLHEQAGFESVIFEAPRPPGSSGSADSIFVKATWSERRTLPQIEAEMRFAGMLADAGVRVARPVRLGGELVVSIPADGGAFHISATERAPGEPVRRADLQEAHFVQWGRLLGQMHAVASRPAARELIAARPEWLAEHRELVRFARDPAVRSRYESLLAEVGQLPADPGVFGLMHTDVHASNVHWEGHTPTAFDFDDCAGFWYASDVAIVLYYTFTAGPGSDAIQQEFERNLAAIRSGYDACHSLPDTAWDTLPLFLNLRDAVLYLVIERSIPPEQRGDRLADVTQQRLERLRNGHNAMGLRFPPR